MPWRLKILLLTLAGLIIVVGIWFYIYPPFGEAVPLEPRGSRVSIFIYPEEVVANGENNAKIIAVVTDKQNPVSGTQVLFKSSLGDLSSMSAETDGDGQAVVYITSREAGEATITAISGTVSKKKTINFLSIK